MTDNRKFKIPVLITKILFFNSIQYQLIYTTTSIHQPETKIDSIKPHILTFNSNHPKKTNRTIYTVLLNFHFVIPIGDQSTINCGPSSSSPTTLTTSIYH